MPWLGTVGTFRSAATNNGTVLRRDGGSTEWWLVIDIDPELGRYLRAEYALSRYRTMQPPLWGARTSR